jgi:RNA ligase (TIGR02306 family)
MIGVKTWGILGVVAERETWQRSRVSTLRVTAERLVVDQHPRTDTLELAQIGLYRSVVEVGAFRTGDIAVYLPEGAVLPPELIAELGLAGKLAGPNGDRVKAVLRHGELSQGIVCRPSALSTVDLSAAAADGRDLAGLLGVTRWEPPVPAHLSGTLRPAPDLLPWPEIENIRRYPDLFTPGEPVVVTEKIHGTACLLSHLTATNDVLVSSKRYATRRTAIRPAASSLYWRAIRAFEVAEFAADLAKSFRASRVGLFGEVYGRGIQDLCYGTDASRQPGYALFDIAVEVAGTVRWLDPADVLTACDGRLPTVPMLFEGAYDTEHVVALAEGAESISGRAVHLREGVVVRPAVGRMSALISGRAIGKLLSEAYLTRREGTEFE